ncbi:hypothetical protein GUITHDRAFT_149154 [Guillardia theta CCMP2712]|uniref:Uncharacterized protein n=1 Tax=Guillardia theta (strain CCMP2712) TaxID=905079 RepID=L1I6F6_GUITC|nr:hypothetical protein GUITHDRAFT_149154 [Guillardia theta CCMP2712]EKX31677.1 hypothetical protein GUITHDRAFT_149154 [Guillardia theta CCMP2712]|eukprot:XP_005818657.1 hypothetical protein GUITHDRAFT_149154 [Guillardia theta CCMP2712]
MLPKSLIGVAGLAALEEGTIHSAPLLRGIKKKQWTFPNSRARAYRLPSGASVIALEFNPTPLDFSLATVRQDPTQEPKPPEILANAPQDAKALQAPIRELIAILPTKAFKDLLRYMGTLDRDQTLILTGWEFAAVLAQLLALFVPRHPGFELIAFGKPCPGNRSFARWYNSMLPFQFSFHAQGDSLGQYCRDLVPRSDPDSLWEDKPHVFLDNAEQIFPAAGDDLTHHDRNYYRRCCYSLHRALAHEQLPAVPRGLALVRPPRRQGERLDVSGVSRGNIEGLGEMDSFASSTRRFASLYTCPNSSAEAPGNSPGGLIRTGSRDDEGGQGLGDDGIDLVLHGANGQKNKKDGRSWGLGCLHERKAEEIPLVLSRPISWKALLPVLGHRSKKKTVVNGSHHIEEPDQPVCNPLVGDVGKGLLEDIQLHLSNETGAAHERPQLVLLLKQGLKVAGLSEAQSPQVFDDFFDPVPVATPDPLQREPVVTQHGVHQCTINDILQAPFVHLG